MIDDTSKEFISRHIGPNASEQKEMLKAISSKSINDLIEKTVPKNILIKDNLKIDEPMSENDALKKIKIALYQKIIKFLEILLVWVIIIQLPQM